MRLNPENIGLTLLQYETGRCVRKDMSLLTDRPGTVSFKQGGSLLAAEVEVEPVDGAVELRICWRVLAGRLPQCAVGIQVAVPEWADDAYAWMAGAVYNGNRFTVRTLKYPPLYLEADAGPDAETVIADIPRLEKGAGPSRVQMLTGDLSAPAMGFVHPGSGKGLYLCTDRIDPSDLLEINESEDRGSACFTVLRGGVRERRYSFHGGKIRTDAPPVESAPDLRQGDVIHQQFTIRFLENATIQTLYDRHFDWMMASGDLPRERLSQAGLSLGEAFRLIEQKYNRDNWDERNELYATTCEPDSDYYYQTGWCGGGIADSALLCGKDPLSRQRAERALNRLCREGQLPGGFFYGKRLRDGTWAHDFAAYTSRPYLHKWNLVRREADLLLYLLKACYRPGLTAARESVELWRASARKLADALCRLWEHHGQLGHFINAETGDVAVGGSASGGAVPAGLCLAYREFGDKRHLEAAVAIAGYFEDTFTRKGLSTGGPGDACQAPDSESCAALLESYVTLYEVTAEERWLVAAKAQAAQVASWIMPYDFPFPEETEFGRLGIPTTGSVFANAQNKHSAPGICTHSGDCLRRLARHSGDGRYEQLLDWIARQITWTVSREDRPIHDPEGRPMPPGWICERVNTSDWDHNVGGIFYGSTWCEVSLMLMAVEVGDSGH